MALEFIIEKNCTFKDKYKDDLLYILDLMQKTYYVKKLPEVMSPDNSTDTYSRKEAIIQFPSDNRKQRIEEVEAYLVAHRNNAECSDCPANSSHLDYGCYNRISYPISEVFEEELMNRLPPAGSLAYNLLIQGMKDFPIVAKKELKNFRKQGFTERPKPIKRMIKQSFISSGVITSDFFLHLLFFSGDLLQVPHMKMLLLFWGILPHSTIGEELNDEEYLEEEIHRFLEKNSFSPLSEMPLIRSLCLGVLLKRPVALLV